MRTLYKRPPKAPPLPPLNAPLDPSTPFRNWLDKRFAGELYMACADPALAFRHGSIVKLLEQRRRGNPRTWEKIHAWEYTHGFYWKSVRVMVRAFYHNRFEPTEAEALMTAIDAPNPFREWCERHGFNQVSAPGVEDGLLRAARVLDVPPRRALRWWYKGDFPPDLIDRLQAYDRGERLQTRAELRATLRQERHARRTRTPAPHMRAEEFAAIRARLQCTIDSLATKLGRSWGQVFKYEHGKPGGTIPNSIAELMRFLDMEAAASRAAAEPLDTPSE